MSDRPPAFKAETVYLDTSVLDKITDEIRPKAADVVETYGTKIASDWAADVRVDTSAFRNSILSESGMSGEMQYTAQDGVEYGIWNELGTSKMAANPSLTNAVEKNREPFYNAFTGLFE